MNIFILVSWYSCYKCLALVGPRKNHLYGLVINRHAVSCLNKNIPNRILANINTICFYHEKIPDNFISYRYIIRKISITRNTIWEEKHCWAQRRRSIDLEKSIENIGFIVAMTGVSFWYSFPVMRSKNRLLAKNRVSPAMLRFLQWRHNGFHNTS